MEFSQNQQGEILFIHLNGSLDSEGAADIEQKFIRLTGSNQKKIIINMQKVDFISSVGIGLLLNHAKAFEKVGTQMRLFGIQDKVLKILQTAGLLKMLKIYNSMEECLNSF
jgi:anti-sigma B factor antagonist